MHACVRTCTHSDSPLLRCSSSILHGFISQGNKFWFYHFFLSLSPSSFPYRRLLPGYARKDPPTCQAVGPYPLIREVGPMRDIRVFPKATRVPRLAPNTTHVPHRGLLTLTQESFQPPNDTKLTWDRFCPVEMPPISSYTVPVPEIMCVPLMYETEYKCYGSGKPKLVWEPRWSQDAHIWVFSLLLLNKENLFL